MERVQVEIYGQVYSLKGADDPAHIRELASFVDKKMKDIEKGTGTVDPHRVAILAALTAVSFVLALFLRESPIAKA